MLLFAGSKSKTTGGNRGGCACESFNPRSQKQNLLGGGGSGARPCHKAPNKNVKSDDSAKAHGSGLELALCIDGCLLRLDVSRTGGLHWFLQSWVALRGGRTARKHPKSWHAYVMKFD